MGAARTLNPKHMKFAHEYVKNGGNGSRAMVAAGYSKKTIKNSTRLKRNEDIQIEIRKAMQKVGMNLETTLKEHNSLILQDDDKKVKNSAIELHYKVIGALSNDRNNVQKAPVGVAMFIDGDVSVTEPPKKGRNKAV